MDRRVKFLLIVTGFVALFLLIVILTRPAADDFPLSPTPSLRTSTPQRSTATPTPRRTAATSVPRTAETPAITPSLDGTQPAVQSENEFYVSPDGSPDGDGSKENPWSLQFALDHPPQVQPGSTVWLLGGIYRGSFTAGLNGAEGKPIIVRAVPGERVILTNDDRVLDIANASYLYLWGFEITATENSRNAVDRPETAYGVRINQGSPSHHIKFINLIVHDVAAQGFGWWRANTDSEIYGSLIFFNGVDNQLDHGIYVNNQTGEKRIVDNIIFDNASHGIHAYGSDKQELNNLYIEGNTVFNNGSIGYSIKKAQYGIYKRNILVGGHLVAENPVILSNYTYYPGDNGAALNLGYEAGSTNAIVESNYFAGGVIEMRGENLNVTMNRNTLTGPGMMNLAGVPAQGNDLFAGFPTGPQIFVRPNKYEAARANVTVYNWDRSDFVMLSYDLLAGVDIQVGDYYELRNVQDYFNDVITGTYQGGDIEIPMKGHSVAQPLGLSYKPASTFPEFGAFVLQVIR